MLHSAVFVWNMIFYFFFFFFASVKLAATHWDQIKADDVELNTTELHAWSKACWDGVTHTMCCSMTAEWADDLSGAVSCNC